MERIDRIGGIDKPGRHRRICGVLAVILFMTILPPGVAGQAVVHTVDASTDWVFVALSSPSVVVDIDNPTMSSEWDLAFLGTEVMLNAESVGPAGVTAYCLCRNQAATADEIQLFTPDSELPAFEAVTAADGPSDAAGWSTSAFTETPWYRYNLRGEHFIWPTYDVYLLKRGDDAYKLQIVGYYGPSGEPRQVAFRFDRL